MTQHVTCQKLTDDDIRKILLTPPDVSNVALAAEFNVSHGHIHHIRARRSFRVIKIAEQLGLIDPLKAREGWLPHRGVTVAVVHGRARRS